MEPRKSDLGYFPKSGDELKFMLKHLIKLVKKEKPADDDKHFKASHVKTYDRSKDRYGYTSPQDIKVYEDRINTVLSNVQEIWGRGGPEKLTHADMPPKITGKQKKAMLDRAERINDPDRVKARGAEIERRNAEIDREEKEAAAKAKRKASAKKGAVTRSKQKQITAEERIDEISAKLAQRASDKALEKAKEISWAGDTKGGIRKAVQSGHFGAEAQKRREKMKNEERIDEIIYTMGKAKVRKNKETGKLEKVNPDGSTVPFADASKFKQKTFWEERDPLKEASLRTFQRLHEIGLKKLGDYSDAAAKDVQDRAVEIDKKKVETD